MLGWPQTHDVEPQTASMNPAIGHAFAYAASTGSVSGEEIIDQGSRTAGTGPVALCGVLTERSRPVAILVRHKVMMTLGPRIDHRKAMASGAAESSSREDQQSPRRRGRHRSSRARYALMS